ncbi:MAG: hypothetical protein IT290_08780 [Deltaproteobacteria bacterium]|nr:hypothetical protein [Deltaproteobacteria bacterium]
MRPLRSALAHFALLFVTTSAIAQVSGDGAIATEDFRPLLSVDLQNGELTLLESAGGATLAVQVEMATKPECRFDFIENPDRAVFECDGLLLKGQKPVGVNSSLVKRLRFGQLGGGSKFVLDLAHPLVAIETKREGERGVTFAFGRKGIQRVASKPAAGDTASQNSISAPLNDSGSGSASTIVHRPPPPVEIKHGETELASLLFVRDPESSSPTMKVVLRGGRKATLEKTGALEYILTIPIARISSPIFKLPQMAPEDMEPFVRALAVESISANTPVAVHITIELSKSIPLRLIQSGGELVITPDALEAGPQQ